MCIISFKVLSSFSEIFRQFNFSFISDSKRPSIVDSSLSTERSANSARVSASFILIHHINRLLCELVFSESNKMLKDAVKSNQELNLNSSRRREILFSSLSSSSEFLMVIASVSLTFTSCSRTFLDYFYHFKTFIRRSHIISIYLIQNMQQNRRGILYLQLHAFVT